MSWAELLFGEGTLAALWRSRDKDGPEVETGITTQQNKVRSRAEGQWEGGGRQREVSGKTGFSG